MALGNWATFSINEKGEVAESQFVSPAGVIVEIYKNWLYVSDAMAWDNSSNYNKPVIMEIRQGELTYKNLNIFAMRGPQDGIYAIIYNNSVGLMGCGVDAYDGGVFVGVRPSSIDWFRKELIKIDERGAFNFDIPEQFLKEKG